MHFFADSPQHEDKYDHFNKAKDESENNLQNSPNIRQGSLVRNISKQLEDLKLQDPTDTNCSSDSDNQSTASLYEVDSTRGVPEEFVMVF